MTTSSTTLTRRGPAALDARLFLLGEDGADGLRDAVRGAVSGVPDSAAALRQVADDRLADVAAGFLDVDLGAVAVAGWRRHRQLLDAAHQTLDDPDLTAVVELVEHRTSSTWRPRVEVRVGGAPVAHLGFVLTATVRVAGLMASVRRGLLTHVGGGRGELHAQFSLGGQVLLERRAPFDAGLQVPLGDGIVLLPPRRPAAVPVGQRDPSVVAGRPDPSHSPSRGGT